MMIADILVMIGSCTNHGTNINFMFGYNML